jgi:hypothetical protein
MGAAGAAARQQIQHKAHERGIYLIWEATTPLVRCDQLIARVRKTYRIWRWLAEAGEP